MKVYTAHFSGAPIVAYTRKTADDARDAVMASGQFTVNDRWEKAERLGWTVRAMALVEIKKGRA